MRWTSLFDSAMEVTDAKALRGGAVRHVQLTREGTPQALLSNRSAWLYHAGLACWLCLADAAFAASPFTSLLPLNPALQGTASQLFACIAPIWSALTQ